MGQDDLLCYVQQEFLHRHKNVESDFEFPKIVWSIQKCEGQQKNFSNSDLHITNYARELVPLAYFLAILFARKGKILSTKTC